MSTLSPWWGVLALTIIGALAFVIRWIDTADQLDTDTDRLDRQTQVKASSCDVFGHQYRDRGTVWSCRACGHREPNNGDTS